LKSLRQSSPGDTKIKSWYDGKVGGFYRSFAL
jgi:hypothetical protein